MSLSASGESVSQKRTLSSLLAGRVVKRPKQEDVLRLQTAAIQLLEQQQDLCSLLREAGNPDLCNVFHTQNGEPNTAASLLVCELRRQASQLGVPVAVLSVKMMLERLMEITGAEDEEGGLLTSSQRVQLCVLLESSRQLLSQGAVCPKLLWQQYRRDQRRPHLEVVYHLHVYNILPLKSIVDSDEAVRSWLVSRVEALCSWTPPQGDQETRLLQHKVLSTVVGVLVGRGFDLNPDPAAADRRTALLCCSMLDDMLFWLLDSVEKNETLQHAAAGAALWIQLFDAALCGGSVSAETLQRFFTHSLTQTLTYKPRLTVSDAIALQNEWTFAKASRLLTSLFCKLSVVFSVDQLLVDLQQVLETHEVNWKHVLCFLSTLLVYNPRAQVSLGELLSRLLNSAFESYDLENMITAFLLARQAALEGAAIFPSYATWFKMSFGGGSSFHASSKKSLVFLLKFLSDLVPFEPSLYLKVHILQPPYVPVKHRSLLMEYVSLAKTRLADLKESVEDMGLYEDVSGAGGASLQPQCQALQDVEKAVSLFESTGRISAAVMEASIFRRPYFLGRFLPALLTPRMLPVKADARMRFIEALRKADKIPAAQHSSYVDSCHKQRQQDGSSACPDTSDDPLEVLKVQLQDFTQLVVEGSEGETWAQLSRISHTLSVLFPGRPEELLHGRTVIELHVDGPPAPRLHLNVVHAILRSFCQCMLNASRANPPNRQSQWASWFVSVLPGNTQFLSSLLHRLWDLFHNQGSSLSAAHLLGLAAFVVHLHASMSHNPLVQLVPPVLPEPVPVGEALSSALVCSTQADMLFCVRLCVAAVCYGVCRGDSLPRTQQQDFILSSFYKKLLYLVPRMLPEARRPPVTAGGPIRDLEDGNLWSRATDGDATWRTTARHLWRNPTFRQLENTPGYQLLFSEWLANELRVQRSEDALTDPERQEYQQWVCSEVYLPRLEEHGGCGGDVKNLCSHLLNAIMDQPLSHQNLDKGSCLPDLLSRLQEFIYDMEVTDLAGGRADVCDLLFESVSQRCFSASQSISLQHTLNTWNRVLLTLPAALLVRVKCEGGRTTLDVNSLIEHVNQHQREACSPVGLLSCHLTSHLVRGVLSASARCHGYSGEEVNKAWSQISLRCPLLLVSTVHWWQRLSPGVLSLWRRLCDGAPLPQQLRILSDCQTWACRLEKGLMSSSSWSPPPAASALLLAASLHRAWRSCCHDDPGFSTALNALRLETDSQARQVLVFLLFLCVNDHLSSLLYPQERSHQADSCRDLLDLVVDSADWLLLFKSTAQERGVYQSVAMVTSDAFSRLMPWAFYSLMLQQSGELLQRAASCPGFLHAAVRCYVGLLQLFLEVPAGGPSGDQTESFEILIHAKQFLLRVISQSSPSTRSSNHLRQLESQCADLDPEVAEALSVHLDPPGLSPEMDFL